MNKKTVNVVVDVQGSFCSKNGSLYVPGANDMLFRGAIDKVVRGSNITIYTMDTHGEDYASSDEAKLFPPHCSLSEKSEWGLVCQPRLIEPDDIRKLFLTLQDQGINVCSTSHTEYNHGITEIFVPKDKFSVWEGNSSFRSILDINDINPLNSKIVVSGVASDYCVESAAEGFLKLGFEVEFNHAACLGISSQSPEVADKLGVRYHSFRIGSTKDGLS